MRKVILFLLVFGTLSAQGQTKELSVSDAVSKQWSTLAPDRLWGLQFVPGTDNIVFQQRQADGLYLMQETVKAAERQKLFSILELNNATGLKMTRLPSFTWESSNRVRFKYANGLYQFDIKGKTGKQLTTWDEKGENVEIEPSSHRVAYTIENNVHIGLPDGKSMAVTRSADPEIVSGQAIHRYEFGISKGLFWSSKGNFLAFYQKDESAVTDYPMLNNHETPATVRNVKYPMAGQDNEKARVGVYDIAQGKTTWLETGDADQFLSCLTWGPDERFVYVTIVNRAQDHIKVNKYDAQSGKLVKTLFEEKDEKYVEPEHDLLFLPGRSDQFIWWSERDGFMHLYLYDTNGKLLRQLTTGEWEVEHVIDFGPKGSRLYVQGTSNQGLGRQIYQVDVRRGGTRQISKEHGTWDAELHSAGSYLLATHSSTEVPRRHVVLDLKGKVVRTLLTADNPLSDYRVGSGEFVDVKARDGQILHAWMIKPPNFDPAQQYPVFVYVYGGPRAQMVSDTWLGGARMWMQHVAAQGYIVWILDNRGSENRGIAFEQAVFRNLGTLEMSDQLDGVNYLKSLPYVNGDRMGVHGWSFGGFMTASLMTRAAGTFKVGVAGGPVTDWAYYEIMYGEKYMDTPEENPDGYKTARLMEHADKLQDDLLLIHGDQDDVVVMQHNLRFVEACVKAGKPIDLMVYPGHKHNVYGPDRVHLMEKVINYITERL